MNTSSVTTSSHSHLDVLDGLRGIAILWVVWFHIWQLSWFGAHFKIFGLSLDFDFIGRSGYLGVELFFFISGICLTLPYVRSYFRSEPTPSVSLFIYKRCLKILPSYYFAILILMVFKIESFDP